MEGMFLHGAAHIFFENKLADTESHFNTKFKKFEQMFRDELREMSKLHTHEIRKIKNEVKLLRKEVSDIRKSEEDLSVEGMDKISKLSNEVKSEVNEIKKIKSEVNQLKQEVTGIRKSEEDISNIGRDSISKLSEEFKGEVMQMKAEIKVIKKDIVIVKEMEKAKQEKECNHEDNNEFEPVIQRFEKNPTDNLQPFPIHENLFTIIESPLSSEEETDLQIVSSNETEKGSNEKNETENILKQNYDNIEFDHPVYQDDMKKLNDDQIRRFVFASSSQESSDYPESDAVSDDEKTESVNKKEEYVSFISIP